MDIRVRSLSEHRTATGQDVMLGGPQSEFVSLAPGGSTSCFWSSSCTTCCGVVLVDVTDEIGGPR
ncbi:MAG TPA: hypothetical protein VEV43_10280 [Actinomycetota bacterium]|nr:hypothetical protein [Actinomycetota bacterium]